VRVDIRRGVDDARGGFLNTLGLTSGALVGREKVNGTLGSGLGRCEEPLGVALVRFNVALGLGNTALTGRENASERRGALGNAFGLRRTLIPNPGPLVRPFNRSGRDQGFTTKPAMAACGS